MAYQLRGGLQQWLWGLNWKTFLSNICFCAPQFALYFRFYCFLIKIFWHFICIVMFFVVLFIVI